MDTSLESVLDRANELLTDLETEYENCLRTKDVTKRAENLTLEVLQKLRSALDYVMRLAWKKYILPTLSEDNKRSTRVYFPITDNLNAFRSTLGRGHMAGLNKISSNLYDFLIKQQPFSSDQNKWLELLANIAAEGKHIRLIPQKCTEHYRIKVTGPGDTSVSWDPSSVKFGAGVSVIGAPVDPQTQRIVPTPGVTEQVEIWVCFLLDDYEINALGFCKETCQKVRKLIGEMLSII